VLTVTLHSSAYSTLHRWLSNLIYDRCGKGWNSTKNDERDSRDSPHLSTNQGSQDLPTFLQRYPRYEDLIHLQRRFLFNLLWVYTLAFETWRDDELIWNRHQSQTCTTRTKIVTRRRFGRASLSRKVYSSVSFRNYQFLYPNAIADLALLISHSRQSLIYIEIDGKLTDAIDTASWIWEWIAWILFRKRSWASRFRSLGSVDSFFLTGGHTDLAVLQV